MVTYKVCLASVLIVLGVQLLVGSILLFVFSDDLIQMNVKQECQLHEGTKIYDNWRNPPVPFKISFYFFNITDQEFVNGTKTPVVEEVGPFVYRETRPKVDVLTHDNGTISYRELRSYEFDEAASIGPNTTLIFTMNVVYMTLINYVQTETVASDMRDFMIQMLEDFAHPVMNHTVAELLWGYNDTVLAYMQMFDPTRTPTTFVSVFNASVGDAGLDTFLINNGIDVYQNVSDRLKSAGNIEAFNGRPHLSYWTNEYANMINGTDSTLWHSGATKDDQVYIFTPDLCRSLKLQYADTLYNPFDIETLRFILPSTVFDKTPDNEGFCLNRTNPVDNTTKIECLPGGLMSLRSCLKPSGSDIMPIPLPIIASSPHFLGAEESIQQSVRGLTPDPTKHRSFMDVEPITGTVMNGSRRMQININVVNSPNLTDIARIKPFVYPILWLDEHAEIDQKHADEFHTSVMQPVKLLLLVKYLLLSFGIVLILLSIILTVLSCLKGDPSEKQLLILNR